MTVAVHGPIPLIRRRRAAASGLGCSPKGRFVEHAGDHSLPLLKQKGVADLGCGACVAACPNGSPSLFTGAKIGHLGLLPQGQPERDRRVLCMVEQADVEGFGGCSWHDECQAARPKEISIDAIAHMHHDCVRASLRKRAR